MKMKTELKTEMDITAQEVLNSLFNADEMVCLRVFEDRGEGIFPGAKYTEECGKFASLEGTLRNHNAMNRGVFFTVNYGGHCDEAITRINAQFVEMDKANFDEQRRRIAAYVAKEGADFRVRDYAEQLLDWGRWIEQESFASIFAAKKERSGR